MPAPEAQPDPLAWQRDVWDRMSRVYEQEIDPRLASIVDGVVRRAAPRTGLEALDVGCGTGSVALKLAAAGARVHAFDISDEMLRLARARAAHTNLALQFEHGSAERLPAADASADLITAGLSVMFVPDQSAVAAQIARVLRPGGRFVASVWGPPDKCDIVLFQKTLGAHAPEPPVKGVGPGSLADPQPFLAQLAEHGVTTQVETEVVRWIHPNLQHALDVFAPVTAHTMSPEQLSAATAELRSKMWPSLTSQRVFRNTVLYLVGERK